MALKIDTNQSATAYHVIGGATLFPYAIDAQHAISNHPLEWSENPWSRADAEDARRALADRHEQDRAEAEANGLPLPAPFPELPPLSPEDEAAIEEHARAVEEANERLRRYREYKEQERLALEQVARDEAIVASPPPQPDPTIRRPFGRKGEPTKAEIEAAERKAAKKAAEEKLVADKAEADRLANSNATFTS